MERRTFLRAGAFAFGGTVLAACTGKKESSKVDVFVGGQDFVAGIDNYVAFALSGVAPSSVDVGFKSDDGSALGTFTAHRRRYAKPEPGLVSPVFYSVDVRFPKPGIWRVDVGEGSAHVSVRARADSGPPIPGDAAVSVETPTVRDHRGVDPICTRVPACPLHTVSLAAALRTKKPIAFFVGSPKFCTSRTCGPNLDELLNMQRRIDGEAIFIHAEVHPDDEAETIRRFAPSPAFEAWKLQSEPWLFLLDQAGKVAKRYEGPVTLETIAGPLVALIK